MPVVLARSSTLAVVSFSDVAVHRLLKYFNIFPTCIVCRHNYSTYVPGEYFVLFKKYFILYFTCCKHITYLHFNAFYLHTY